MKFDVDESSWDKPLEEKFTKVVDRIVDQSSSIGTEADFYKVLDQSIGTFFPVQDNMTPNKVNEALANFGLKTDTCDYETLTKNPDTREQAREKLLSQFKAIRPNVSGRNEENTKTIQVKVEQYKNLNKWLKQQTGGANQRRSPTRNTKKAATPARVPSRRART